MHDRWGVTDRPSKRNKFKNEGPFEIEITGESTVSKYFRSKSVEDLQKYNSAIQAWGETVRSGLVSSIGSMVTDDKKLSSTLKNTYYADKKSWSGRLIEIDRIGFSFRPEGVYIHMGVGRGYHRSGGVTTRTSKTNTFGRQPILWFNPVIEQHIAELSAIVEAYADDITINATRIYLDQ